MSFTVVGFVSFADATDSATSHFSAESAFSSEGLVEGEGGDSGVLGLTSGAVRLVAVSAWTMGLAADTIEAGWVAGRMGAVWAVGFSSWAAGRSLAELKSTPTAGLTIHERFPLRRRRRRRLTHHPHGTHRHGVGLVHRVISGGILVITSSREGMDGLGEGGLGGQHLSCDPCRRGISEGGGEVFGQQGLSNTALCNMGWATRRWETRRWETRRWETQVFG